MYSQPRRFLWYLGLVVLVLFVFKSPVIAAHVARGGGELLSTAASVLAKLIGAL